MSAFALLIAIGFAKPAPPVTAIAFSPDGKSVIAGSTAGVRVLSFPKLSEVARLDTKLRNISAIAFSPGGKRLLLAGGKPAQTGEVELWSWPKPKRLLHRQVADDLVSAIAWETDGESCWLGSLDRSTIHFRFEKSKPRSFKVHSRGVTGVALLADHVVSCGIDGTLRLVERKSGKVARSFNNHVGVVVAVAARPGKRAIPIVASAGEDRTVRFWQPTIGRLMRFVRLPAKPSSIIWSPDGAKIHAACINGSIHNIDPDTAEITASTTLKGPPWLYAIATHPNGESLCTAGLGGVMQLPAK